MPLELTPAQIEQVRSLAEKDPNSKIRAAALTFLEQNNLPDMLELAQKAIEQDSAYNVIGSAIQVINKIDKSMAAELVKSQEDAESEAILQAIAQIYAQSGDIDKLAFFQKHLNKMDGYSASSFYGYYQTLALAGSLEEAVEAMEVLKSIGVNQQQSPWRRFAATKSIVDMANEWQSKANRAKNKTDKEKLNAKVDILASFVKEIKSKEQTDQLQSLYRQIVIIERT